MTDDYGLPVEFEITGGEINDCSAVPSWIARLLDMKVIVADTSYDREFKWEQITNTGSRESDTT